MSIHILTQDAAVQSRLEKLIPELEHECTFHTELSTVQVALKKLKKTDSVFYDLQLEDTLWAFEPLYTACRRTNLVAVEPLTKGTSADSYLCPEGVEHYLLISPDERRSKTHLQNILREIAQKAAKSKKPKKKKAVAKKKKATATKGTSNSTQATIVELAPQGAPATFARYLQTNSASMQTFLADLHTAAGQHQCVMIEGDEGAEFELAARELNFRANGDECPLLVLDPMQFTEYELERFQEDSQNSRAAKYCYIGLSFELSSLSAEHLSSFLDKLQKQTEAAPSIHLIIGHVIDSEDYLPRSVLPPIKVFREQSHQLKVPNMSSREDDIPHIAHSIFSTLRMAHPFLSTRTITNSAIQHLKEECASMDYCRITRVLRNAMALSQSDVLTEKELKNFNDNSPTTQHLIESLADEQFFNAEDGEPENESGVA